MQCKTFGPFRQVTRAINHKSYFMILSLQNANRSLLGIAIFNRPNPLLKKMASKTSQFSSHENITFRCCHLYSAKLDSAIHWDITIKQIAWYGATSTLNSDLCVGSVFHLLNNRAKEVKFFHRHPRPPTPNRSRLPRFRFSLGSSGDLFLHAISLLSQHCSQNGILQVLNKFPF